MDRLTPVLVCALACLWGTACQPDTVVPETPPPATSEGYVRPERVAAPTAAPPPGVSAELLRTAWRALGEQGTWQELTIGDSMLYRVPREGLPQTLRMDHSSPLCLGYPNCLVVQEVDAGVRPLFFWRNADTLHVVLCTRLTPDLLVDGAPPTLDELQRNSGMTVRYAVGDVVCLDPGTEVFSRTPLPEGA